MNYKKIVNFSIPMALLLLSMVGVLTPNAGSSTIFDQQATINGWQVSDSYSTPQEVTYMKSNFTVPKNPKKYDGQVNFFFPGIQSYNYPAILQPVIAYSNSYNQKSISRPQWAMAAWYATDSDSTTRESQEVAINPGNKMYGSVFRTNIRNSVGDYKWTVFVRDETTGRSTTLQTFVKETDFTQAKPAAMESYWTKNCGNLAGSPFTVTNFHTYNSAGREMTTPSYGQYVSDGSCGAKIAQNTPQHWVSLSNLANY